MASTTSDTANPKASANTSTASPTSPTRSKFTSTITARLGAESLGAILRVRAEAPTIKLPLLILQGSADKLVDPSAAQDLYDSVQSTDKTLKVYPGLYHEVFNEPEHPQVLDDVANW